MPPYTPEQFAADVLALTADALEHDTSDAALQASMQALVKRLKDDAAPADDNTITVLKADDEKQIVWGWALVSVEKGQPVTDLQGDVVDTDDLQHAVHTSYMEDRIGKAMHSGGPVGEVVDSIVFTKDLQKALGIDLGREGWFVGMKIHKSAVWELVKSGKLSAFSIGGEGERHPIDKAWSPEAREAALEARRAHGSGAGEAAHTHAGNAAEEAAHAAGGGPLGKVSGPYHLSAAAHRASATAAYDSTPNRELTAMKAHTYAAAAHERAGNTAHATIHRGLAAAHNTAHFGAVLGKSAPALFSDVLEKAGNTSHGPDGRFTGSAPADAASRAAHEYTNRHAGTGLNKITRRYQLRAAKLHAHAAEMQHSMGNESEANEHRYFAERHIQLAKSDDPTGKQDLHATRYVQGLLDQLKQRTAQTTTSIQGAQLDAGTHQDLVGPVHDHIKDAHQHLRAGNNDKAQASITAGHQALDSADQELEYTHGVSGDDNTMKKNWSPQAREAAAEARRRATEASNNASKVGTPEAHRNAAQSIRESQALHADNPKEMRAHEKAARYHEKEATERQAASDYKTYGPKAAGPEHKLTPAAHAIHQHLVSQPDGHSASYNYMHLDGHSQADLKHGVAQLKAKGLAHGGSYSAHGESHGYLNAAANVPVRKAAMFNDVMRKAAKL